MQAPDHRRHETTVGLIGNGVLALMRHPDQLARWRDDPSIARNAVDELLRYDGTVQMVQRVVTRPVSFGGRVIPEGEQLIVGLAAANRDPAMFEAPDRLDLGRPNANRHLAFGGGIHHCLGAALARMEGEVAMDAVVRAFPKLQQAGPLVRRDMFNLRGLEHLPVTLR